MCGLHGIQHIWRPSDADGHVTMGQQADSAAVCKSQKNPKTIAKKFRLLSMTRLHDIKCTWGPSDAYRRVMTGRKADSAFVCKSQKNSK